MGSMPLLLPMGLEEAERRIQFRCLFSFLIAFFVLTPLYFKYKVYMMLFFFHLLISNILSLMLMYRDLVRSLGWQHWQWLKFFQAARKLEEW